MLVNVIVATEGFDLPDASCIIIARPTMSLALYLQMVGRGLRPKPDGGDCLILDLAANSVTHGLPEDYREWSLEPRGTQKSGEAPIVVCPLCEIASPAASHNCRVCGHAFGKECDRCGRWRAHKRWHYETHCGDAHQLVCDLCHIDAHILAHLQVAPPLDELIDFYNLGDEIMLFADEVEINDELAAGLCALFKELLEQERQNIAGADDVRRNELRQIIDRRGSILNDDDELDNLFGEYIAGLPESPNRVQERRIFGEWEDDVRSEFAGWQIELAELENRPVNKRAVFNSARNKAMHLLGREAHDADLMPGVFDDEEQSFIEIPWLSDSNEDDWCSLSELGNRVPVTGQRPLTVRFPDGTEGSARNWRELYAAIAEWLVDAEHLSRTTIPSRLNALFAPQEEWYDSGQRKTIALKNGMFLYAGMSALAIVSNAKRLLEAFGESPSQFHIQLR